MAKKDEISNGLLEFEKVERITYKDAYVAFIDILGFRQIVSDNNIEKISLYYSIVNNVVHKKLKSPLEFGGDYNIQVMSDSIVIAITPNIGDGMTGRIKSFRALCVAVGALQFELALNNFWLRGGITFGPIAFLENNFVVGPALVNSYVLEDEKAKVPRVIVDPLVPSILKMDDEQFLDAITQRANPDTFYPWILGKKSIPDSSINEYTFIHYFYFFEQEWEFVVEAAEAISRHLKGRLVVRSKDTRKYVWVAQYLKSLKMSKKVKVHFEWLDTIDLSSGIPLQ